MGSTSLSTAWTLTVRVTHWLIAFGVMINFVNDTGYWHRMIGYGCLLLIAIRVLHSYTTKQTSSHFSRPRLTKVFEHILEIRHKKISNYNGHNPLGQIAVYLMWGLIILLGFSGWLSRTDVFWGEDGPVEVHTLIAYWLIFCVLLHISAVLLMSKLQKKNLIKPMILSKRNLSDNS
jgi:cytochrome b